MTKSEVYDRILTNPDIVVVESVRPNTSGGSVGSMVVLSDEDGKILATKVITAVGTNVTIHDKKIEGEVCSQ